MAVEKQERAPEPSLHSQPHPEPNCAPALLWKSALNASKEPKAALESVEIRAVGAGRVEGVVELGHVGVVVLAVVDLHGARVDVRLERVVGVAELRELERVGHR